MTLIEIMLVILIMGLMISAVAMGAASLPRTRLRTSALRTASALRHSYVHALISGKATRLSLQLQSNQCLLEDSDDAHTLDPPSRAQSLRDVANSANSLAEEMTELRPRAPRAVFRRFQTLKLESGVFISRLYVEHEPQEREEGVGYVNFFAGGQSERALIQLRNTQGDVYSVLLHPLTGRTEVFDRAVEPPTLQDRDTGDTSTEFDERESQVTGGPR